MEVSALSSKKGVNRQGVNIPLKRKTETDKAWNFSIGKAWIAEM